MPAVAIPAIVGAYSAWQSHRDATNAAKLSPAEQQAQQTQLGASKALTSQASTLTNYGLPKLQQAGNYFSTLAGGNRAATAQALAPETANINDLYGGTQRTLQRFLKGPDRDYQMGELARQRTGQIGGLFAGARAQGVSGLVSLGEYGVGQGTSALGGAAGIAGSVAGMGQSNRIYAGQLQQQAGSSTAALILQLLKMYAGRSGGSGFASIPSIGVSSGIPTGVGTTVPGGGF